MRYDMRVLWVEDTTVSYDEMKALLESHVEEMGITIKFNHIKDATTFKEKLREEKEGFKVYDMCFMDYSLSNNIFGSDIIKELRENGMDIDILFYSSRYEADIRKAIKEDLNSFEGVYVSDREHFEDRSLSLLEKNARRLLSLSNIRGVLMDRTSENDYTVKSYIIKKYDRLSPENKKIITNLLYDRVKERGKEVIKIITKTLDRVEKEEFADVRKEINNLPSYIFPIKLKYDIFAKILEVNDDQSFIEKPLNGYFSEIVKVRNNLAHKKLEVCPHQKNILYYNDIEQFEQRRCPPSCEQHIDDHKISLDQWEKIRKDIIKYDKCFNEVQKHF